MILEELPSDVNYGDTDVYLLSINDKFVQNREYAKIKANVDMSKVI